MQSRHARRPGHGRYFCHTAGTAHADELSQQRQYRVAGEHRHEHFPAGFVINLFNDQPALARLIGQQRDIAPQPIDPQPVQHIR